MAKKKKTHQIINPAERQREAVKRANERMQKAWDLIYSEDEAERQRQLENCDTSHSPTKRDE